MRPERNPLDLNNLPEDYTARSSIDARHHPHLFDDSSSSGYRKKKSGAKDGKDECGKVYECRFCSLKFCKSQALGGHMNRHRQERETETLNRARQLVFSNDNLTPPHLGCHPITPASYHPAAGDPYIRSSVYPQRLYSAGSSSTINITPPPSAPLSQQSFPYPSPSRLNQYPINDYYVGHVLSGGTNNSHSQYSHNQNYMGGGGAVDHSNNYTCIGAPVLGHGFGTGGSSGGGSGQDDGMNCHWGRSYAGGVGTQQQQQRLNPPSSINRFQDGF